ncbi:MAG: hypothetical protein OXC09_01270 [Truepera sp.]|nr:hypothetical protein [Truepera sp.]
MRRGHVCPPRRAVRLRRSPDTALITVASDALLRVSGLALLEVANIGFGAGTVTVAIAVYIAYQQWRTNRRKLELDLYERRLRVC